MYSCSPRSYLKFNAAKNGGLPKVSWVYLCPSVGSAHSSQVLHIMQWLTGLESYINMIDQVY